MGSDQHFLWQSEKLLFASVLITGLLAGYLQYLWLLNIPALARTAEAVVIATVAATLLALKLLPTHPSKPTLLASSGSGVVICVCVSALAATAALFLAEAFSEPRAVINTLSSLSAKSFLLTVLVTAGWVVGLLSATVRVVILKRVRHAKSLHRAEKLI